MVCGQKITNIELQKQFQQKCLIRLKGFENWLLDDDIVKITRLLRSFNKCKHIQFMLRNDEIFRSVFIRRHCEEHSDEAISKVIHC